MKKIFILVLLSLVLFSGCTKQKKADASGKVEVVFWHAMGGPLGDALAKLIDEFNDTHADIHINGIAMGNYTALSQKIMAAVQTGNQPDISQVYESWTSNMMEGDVLRPVADFIAEDETFGDEDLADFYPVFIKCNTIDGQLVSFPFNKSVRVMYYNKDILFQNNMDPNKPPRNWSEFREMCRNLTVDIDGDGVPDRYGTTIKINAWQFENLLLQAGGEIMDVESSKPLFNSPAGVEALKYLTGILNEDKTAYLSPGYDGQNDFLASKVVFYEDSSVSIAYMRNIGIDFNLGISSVPIKETSRNLISGTNVAIFKSEDKRVELAAWEFVKWFTSAEITAKWSEYTYYMPVRRSAFQQPNIKKRLLTNPEIKSVYDQLEYATYEPQISEWFETRKYLEDQVIEKVLRGTSTPKAALDKAAKKLTEMLAKK
ncbi:MAG: ABC transporter substrate-binding protein [Candidatus Stygibacter australis]|nr:ABC transporter substrate-binding protein [Candidatus Stygibacter australis]MDP8320719.1 ABC transporter substrate-binding protein [Candidatus Stygibacter australis]